MTIVSLFLVLIVCDPLSDFFEQPQALVALEKKKKMFMGIMEHALRPE